MAVDYRSYPVLFVDDEAQNLVTFRYALEEHFTVLTAGSGDEALGLLAARDIAVLLADQRMPGMSGVELCARAKQLRPDTVRIIITAYADLHAAIDAINTGQVSRYLVKPWRNDELAEVLRTAIEFVHIQRAMHDMELRLLRSTQARAAVAVQDEIVHEISNPLTAARLTLSEAERALGDALSALESSESSRAREQIEAALLAQRDAVGALQQLEAICVRLRSGGQSSAEPDHCEAARVVDATVRILRRDMERSATVSVVLEGAPIVAIAASALGQVVLNLMMNAAQALEQTSGETRADNSGEGASVTVALREDGGVARLTVRDSGPGIPPDQLGKVFEPYFTTKDEGTGLGLAIVREIVQRAGGNISVQSAPGQGASFEVVLPILPLLR